MQWEDLVRNLNDTQRREMSAALRSMETPQQEAERLRGEVATSKRTLENLRVSEARRQAEEYAAERNRARGAL